MNQKALRRDDILRHPYGAALTAVLILGSTVHADDRWSALIDPENSLSFNFLHGDQPTFRMGLTGWGPN